MVQLSALFGLLATAFLVACAPAAEPAPTRMSNFRASISIRRVSIESICSLNVSGEQTTQDIASSTSLRFSSNANHDNFDL